MRVRLLARLVNLVCWPLARAVSAWDAADRRLASTYATDPEDDDA